MSVVLVFIVGAPARADELAEAQALFIGGIAASVVGDVVVIIGGTQWIVGGRRRKRLRPGR